MSSKLEHRGLFWKFTNKGRRGTFQTDFQYGRGWTKPVYPRLCERGYHVCNHHDLALWACVDLWVVEGRGVVQESHRNLFDSDPKLCLESIRFVRKEKAWNKAAYMGFLDQAADYCLGRWMEFSPGGVTEGVLLDIERFRRGKFLPYTELSYWSNNDTSFATLDSYIFNILGKKPGEGPDA